MRAANGLGKLDLLLLAPGADAQDMAGAWLYVPRLLHEQSLVFLETATAEGEPAIRLVGHGNRPLGRRRGGRPKTHAQRDRKSEPQTILQTTA